MRRHLLWDRARGAPGTRRRRPHAPDRTRRDHPLTESLDVRHLREVVSAAAHRHEDVERAVRLVAARDSGDLAVLRSEIDRGLRTRRFLGYRESIEWAHAARPILTELEQVVRSSPSRGLVELLQRAVGHAVKVIQRADDSSGLIGDLACELLELHAQACDAGAADPVKLAVWMIRFRFKDQDFFEPDPVRYRAALGETGVAAYRKAVAKHEHQDSFAARYAHERLAVLDGDTDQIVMLLGGDLTSPHQFVQVAEAMAELGRDDEVLQWAERGIAETSGWQTNKLYDLACAIHTRRSQPAEALRLRRQQLERMPSSSTYGELRRAAEALGAWEVERDAARAALRAHDPGGLVDALLRDGDTELAWKTATADPSLDPERWLRLAESRERQHPADSLAVYLRVVDEVLEPTDRRAYRAGVRILKRARAAAAAAEQLPAFQRHLAQLREQHRRRPTLIGMLDKAGLP